MLRTVLSIVAVASGFVLQSGVAQAAEAGGMHGDAPRVEDAAGANPQTQVRDPLFPLQWMLRNRSDTYFGIKLAYGIDLNVMPVYKMGITGRGVRVMVVDTGVAIDHEDLAAHVEPTMVHWFDAPLAVDRNNLDPHGTAMAGVIGAIAGNGVGGQGVAPDVRLGSVAIYPSNEAIKRANNAFKKGSHLSAIFGGADFSRHTDIFSGSYIWYEGETAALSRATWDRYESSPQVKALKQLPALREGRGAIFVATGGNEFFAPPLDLRSDDSGPPDTQCVRAAAAGLTCMNAGFAAMSNAPYTIVTAAVASNGRRASYSNTGSTVLVSGLGGDGGFADTPGQSAEPSPWLVTTDLPDCAQGMTRKAMLNSDLKETFGGDQAIFDAFSRQCAYGFTSGTSSATATVSGVIALMLQANPDLTWRDVRMILARTSRVVDAQIKPVKIKLGDASDYIAQAAWTRNGAGLWFHDGYGYGLVDAANAVRTAQRWTRHVSGAMPDTGWIDVQGFERSVGTAGVQLPYGKAQGAGSTLKVAQRGYVELVQVRVRLANANVGDLAIEITSPSGTRSVLRAPFTAFGALGAEGEVLLASNAFMQEPMKGDWRLRVIDVGAPAVRASPRNSNPALLGWTLRVMGGAERPPGHGEQTVQIDEGSHPRWVRVGDTLPR